MNTKKVVSAGIATLAVAGIVALAVSFTATSGVAEPAPTATAVTVDPAVLVEWQKETSAAAKSAEAARVAEAARIETERVAAETAAAAEVARIEAERVEAERVAAEQESQESQREVSTQPEQPAPGPIKCPAGSTANTGDAGNDTSCFPDICFRVTLPDPAYPECVTAFRP